MMKTSLLISLLAIAHRAASQLVPHLQWDPNTAKDCIQWHDNFIDEPEPSIGSSSCEAVRKHWGITPEEFHEWNPSVGLDCKPWNDVTSYCVLTQEKEDNYSSSLTATTSPSTSTAAATTTTSSFSLGPSPTAWTSRGCYIEYTDVHVLEQNMSPANGDASLTIPKCKNSCYRRAYMYAGVQEGNQCWCGSYVGGEGARNQSDCNVPCTGDRNTFCGAKGRIYVFEALENKPVSTSIKTTASASASISTSSGTVSGETRASSGAIKNMAFF